MTNAGGGTSFPWNDTLNTGLAGWQIRPLLETADLPGNCWDWPRSATVGTGGYEAHAVDLDNDPGLEIIVGFLDSAQNQTIVILDVLATGDVQPVDTVDLTPLVGAQLEVNNVMSADVDVDGDMDVVIGRQNWGTLVIPNEGNLTFGSPYTLTTPASAICVEDFDLDGNPDLLVRSTAVVEVLLGQPGLADGNQRIPTPGPTDAGAITPDVNGDGYADLVCSSVDAGVVTVCLSSGQLTWSSGTQFPLGTRVFTLSAGDLNGDGFTDFVAPLVDASKVTIFTNDGNGGFITADIPTMGRPHFSDIADADNDGDFDILIPCFNTDTIQLLRNNGSGSFPEWVYFASGDYPMWAGMADLNEDGRNELLHTSYFGSVLTTHELGDGPDCNANGIPDVDDLATGVSLDCDGNGIPDECDIVNGLDCNGNGIPDSCDIASGFALDCNNNGIPDDCDIANDPSIDANLNSVPDSCEVAGSRYWILSPVTGNWHAVTDELRADEAAQVAINWGGDLVTINDQAENDWLAAQFGSDTIPFWIGLNDAAQEGSYTWLSGEPVNYTNWRAGEPDDAPGLFGADFTVMFPATGKWLDEPADALTFATLPRGVVELVSSDCDSNGIPDTYELLQDPSLDCDGNGIHDLCDLLDPALDCDGDGVLDSCQIAADPSLDCDGNGAIDSCEILADTSLDCDAEQTLDVCQITADPSLDWNGDGLIDTCAGGGFVYCDSNLNAVGLVGSLEPQGSPVIADDSFTLYGFDLPLSQPAMVIMSRSTNYVNPFGGGAGVLCLGAPIRRFNLAAGFPLQFTSPTGDFSLTPPIGDFPGPNAVLPGEVIHFQLWHREFDPATGTPRSNTTDGISVMFR